MNLMSTHYTFNHENMYDWFIKKNKHIDPIHGLNKVKKYESEDLNYNIYNIRPKSTYDISANGGRRLYQSDSHKYTKYPIDNNQVYPVIDLASQYVKLKYPKH